MDKYAVTYIGEDGESWTYTSCLFFENIAAALEHFPYKGRPITGVFRIKLKPA